MGSLFYFHYTKIRSWCIIIHCSNLSEDESFMNRKTMRLPAWVRSRHSFNTHAARQTLRNHRVMTVCEEARCPNRPSCFSRPTAAFLILGPYCTRRCSFCSVASGSPGPVDAHEPENIAGAAQTFGLTHVVITSVTRDDLEDGGATQFNRTVQAVRRAIPRARIEVLTPDFSGNIDALRTVLDAGPDVFNHNLETIARLYPSVRPGADYERSLRLLELAGEMAPSAYVKSGIMLGLGETYDEVLELLKNLRKVKCDFVTIGQYLRPGKANHPVVEYVRPEVFDDLRARAVEMGFTYAASGPLVRSSMNADEIFRTVHGT